MIKLKPAAGLANRMRAIDSAVALARELNTRLEIDWVRGSDLNCPFSLLFESIPDPRVQVNDWKIRPPIYLQTLRSFRKLHLPWFSQQPHFSSAENERLMRFDFKSLPPDKKVIIESLWRFYPGTDRYQIFRPIGSLRKRITDRTSGFDQYTIGVHIRRTDHAWSIEKSYDELFFTQMQRELTAQPLTRFYLATDSMDVKKKFKEVFGDLIMTTPYQASRKTIEGIQEALVEMYTLSHASKILGSYWSSYSKTAADIGKIPVLRITTENVHVP